jgi:hypothetical protein
VDEERAWLIKEIVAAHPRVRELGLHVRRIDAGHKPAVRLLLYADQNIQWIERGIPAVCLELSDYDFDNAPIERCVRDWPTVVNRRVEGMLARYGGHSPLSRRRQKREKNKCLTPAFHRASVAPGSESDRVLWRGAA